MLERLHTFLRNEIKARRGSGLVTPEFMTECINQASNDLWLELIDKEKKGVASNLLSPFKTSSTTGAFSGGAQSIASWSGYQVISASYEGNEAIVAESDIIFNTDDPVKVLGTTEVLDHLLSDDYDLTGINGTIYQFDLPENWYQGHKVFYQTVSGTEYEGQILNHDEFLDRKNSVIVVVSETQPIARIVDDQIEIHPAPPAGSSVRVPYVAFPSLKRPILRFYDDGTAKDVNARPSSFTGDVTVYAYKTPAVGAATYALSAHGEPSLTVSQDLDWPEQAFSHIASRALFYLGHRNGDQQAINQEAQKETVDKNATS